MAQVSRNHLPHTQTPRTAPRTRGNPLFGNTRELLRDSLEFLPRIAHEHGDVVRFRLYIWPTYLINSPNGVRHVLQEHNRNYDKNVPDYRMLKRFLGAGLLTSEGDSWLRQRRLIQPAFHRQRLAAYSTLMTDATLALLDRWQQAAEHGATLDIAAEMMRLTQRIVGLALFSVDLADTSEAMSEEFTAFNELLTEYFYHPFPPLSVPTTRNRRMRSSGIALDEVVRQIIAQRRRTDIESGDVLSLLLRARDDETGQGMSDEQLRDHVMTFLLAGFETTSNALAWTWYLLALHPAVQQRLHVELERVLGGAIPAVERLAELPYTRMVVEESLRLYPPAWCISRHAIAEDIIDGYRIPKGSFIIICPYTLHRHPQYWENPDAFDPERFAPERSAARQRFTYIPFGGGPHQCIGSGFAMQEAQLILATIAQRFRLRLPPGAHVEPQPLITLRIKSGLPMSVESVA